jgi:circadian clock protein KaiC
MSEENVEEERIKTGIKGLDKVLKGGIPRGNVVLVSGTAGTGKSIFGLEFIYHGAKDFDEPGVFITLEDYPEKLMTYARSLKLDGIDELVQQEKIAIVRTEVFDIDKLVNSIEDLIDQYKAKRVVIDSISVLTALAEKPFLVRRTIYEIINMLKRQNVTAIFTAGVTPTFEGHFGSSIEEYVVDGVIAIFRKLVKNRFIRAIAVVKMHGTAHSEELHLLQITDKGISVGDTDIPQIINF